MSAPAHRGRRVLATALARAESWLLEPVETMARPARIVLRQVVAVVGLGSGCGATTVARALATELARRDPAGAAAVAGGLRAGMLALAGGSAGRLARAIGTRGGRRMRTAGRLCLVEGGDEAALVDAVRPLAPLVLDVGYGQPAGVAVSLADHVLLVASPEIEPALAPVASASLGRVGPPPAVVLNRAGEGEDDGDRWAGRANIRIGRSRGGARLAIAGRDTRGVLGDGVVRLADSCPAAGGE